MVYSLPMWHHQIAFGFREKHDKLLIWNLVRHQSLWKFSVIHGLSLALDFPQLLSCCLSHGSDEEEGQKGKSQAKVETEASAETEERATRTGQRLSWKAGQSTGGVQNHVSAAACQAIYPPPPPPFPPPPRYPARGLYFLQRCCACKGKGLLAPGRGWFGLNIAQLFESGIVLFTV